LWILKKPLGASHDLRIIAALMTLNNTGVYIMNTDFQLVGKTITGVVATPAKGDDPRRIWMLQFSDGTHVEFVSPSARRRLNRVTGGHQRVLIPSEQHVENRANAA
jgi:hypothetical protein